MPARLEEIAGVFCHERFRRDDFVIGQVEVVDNGRRSTVSVKGNAEADELRLGFEYRFYGKRERHPKYGESFAFKTFVRSQPHGQAGTVRYLQEAPHVGRVTAQLLWSKFQGQAVRMLREMPEAAAAAVGGRFSLEKAEAAAAKLKEMAALEDCTIDLVDLLGGQGFPKNTPRELVKAFGNRAAKWVRRNPFLLVLRRFHGCGFLRTDAMYLDLGHPPGRLKRQALCAWHAIASNSEGHTWFPADEATAGIRGKVGGAAVDEIRAIRLAVRAKLLAARRDDQSRLWLAEAKKAEAERYVARAVARVTNEGQRWPSPADVPSLSRHQTEQLANACMGPIGILGGAPGTGKTFAASGLAKLIVAQHGTSSLAVCAPTGKAAVRVTEAMRENGLEIEATTIHRLLAVESLDGGNWRFRHNEANPLPHRFILVDEDSMDDTSLKASLLAARAKGTHILFVGDVNQLPPVGHGAPLRDMIAASVPCGELREIHRNEGTIVRVCHRIRDGETWQPDESIDLDAEPPRNLKLLPAANGKLALERIVQAVKRIGEAGIADPIWDVQVLVAVNKRSALSRRDLNRRLQVELNPQPAVGDSPFREGDKVIQTRNGFLLAAKEGGGNDDGKFFVANGDQGRVVEVKERLTVVEFQNPKRLVKVPRGKQEATGDDKGKDDDEGTGTGCDLDLAYAITCHKAQGSEWPIVIVGLDEYPGARRVCSREWIYTALSRAKKCCFLVGKLSTAHAMCRRIALGKRKTFLVELLSAAMAENQTVSK
jgi:exodeoxyribonuclease V alpha subunit